MAVKDPIEVLVAEPEVRGVEHRRAGAAAAAERIEVGPEVTVDAVRLDQIIDAGLQIDLLGVRVGVARGRGVGGGLRWAIAVDERDPLGRYRTGILAIRLVERLEKGQVVDVERVVAFHGHRAPECNVRSLARPWPQTPAARRRDRVVDPEPAPRVSLRA